VEFVKGVPLLLSRNNFPRGGGGGKKKGGGDTVDSVRKKKKRKGGFSSRKNSKRGGIKSHELKQGGEFAPSNPFDGEKGKKKRRKGEDPIFHPEGKKRNEDGQGEGWKKRKGGLAFCNKGKKREKRREVT